jgi:hypothetical protein
MFTLKLLARYFSYSFTALMLLGCAIMLLGGCDDAPSPIEGASTALPDCPSDQELYFVGCLTPISPSEHLCNDLFGRQHAKDCVIRFADGTVSATCIAECPAPTVKALAACDTLRVVNFVSRCDAGHARCSLRAEAPAGSVATGCMLTVISQPSGTPEQVECVSSCE